MNKRVKGLKDSLRVDKYPLCIEKIRLVLESHRQTDGEPQILRRAKSLANVLDKITIFIEDNELIVGNGASKPMGLEIDTEYGIWSREEIAGLKNEGYTISQEDEAELHALFQDLKVKTLVGRMGEILYEDRRLWPFMLSGVVLPPWKNKEEGSGGGYAQSGMGLGPGLSLMGIEFARVLNEGLNGIILEAEKELSSIRHFSGDSINRVDFLRSAIIAYKAIIRFAGRFADLAAGMAAGEADPARKKELERIAETCRRVPASPATNFYEAVQSFWFVFLVINPSPTAAPGRFDQYMYPFYSKDIEERKITDDQALELLECLRIKDMQLNRTSGKANRKKNAGMAKWHNWTIGGVTPDGEDATNKLSYLILEAAMDCPTPHHTITVRVHDKTPESFMIRALEVVRTGIGMPAFIGDKSYIGFFVSHGAPLREARDYIPTGCLDGNIPGKSRTISIGMFIVPLVFDIFMHNGVDPNTGMQVGIRTGEVENFETFDDFVKAFKEQLAYLMGLASEKDNVELLVTRELFPDPVRSPLMADGIREARDITDRTMPFENGAVLNPIGMINVADSLAAVKKLVYEEKKVSMKQLKAALAANWEGYEEIRKMCLAAPKYGNGDRYVDTIARELYRFWVETTETFDTAFGGKHKSTAISVTSHQPGGELTGATPDGRYYGEILADGTVSPMRGRDTRGPTGVVRSAIEIDQEPFQATLMNMKFHPSALETTEDLRKLASLIKTYFAFNGKHMQFNIVNRETLLDAQEHPENHRDLVVRVAGYSTYFVQLSKAVQDEVIVRTEHQLPS